MMEFLRILLFAKTVLLTPEPIDLIGDMTLRPPEHLTAVTAGACVQIDVSAMISKARQEGIEDFFRRAETMFPSGVVEARLIGKDNQEIVLNYNRRGIAFSNDAVFLELTADGGVPTETEFAKVVLTSRTKLTSVKVSWRNARK